MKLNRIGSFIALGLALVLILSQSASGAVKAQASGFSASLSQQPIQNRQSKIQNPTDQAPYKVTVQGRLTDPSGNPITSAVNVSFNVYTSTVGGSAIFSEGPVSVTPDNRGLLTYQLGSTSVISTALISQFANTLYLGLTVGTDAEMAPRILLTASPYAMSLAPGTVVQGAYDASGNTTDYGVINGVNLDGSSVVNAGLYGKGATGVYGEADPSRGFGAVAGNFVNNGGFPGSQFGLSATSNSTGGHEGYGGFFGSYGGGSGNQYGIYALAGSSNNQQQVYSSIGVAGISVASNNTDFTSVGGVFTSTNTLQGVGAIGYGTTAIEGFATNPTSNIATNGGYFSSSVGNSQRVGVQGTADGTSGGTLVEGAEFSATGNSNADAYGVAAGATGAGNGAAIGVSGTAQGGRSYGGYFTVNGTGGVGMFAQANQPSGLSGDFMSNDTNATIVQVFGRIHATSCCAGASYDIQVRYHGSEPLHAGDILAADGVNETFQGVPTLGVVKATSDNADAAIGVVQYPIHKSITLKDGQDVWKSDDTSSIIQPGELATAIVLGQMQVHVGSSNLKIGTRLTLDASGNLAVADKSAANIIGKVVSQPDKDGNVTVFVNLK